MAITGTSVLVATDLSPRCDRAVDRAAALAAEWNVRLKVVHVLDEAATQQADDQPTEKTVRASLPNPKMDADILLLTGSPPPVIAATAKEQGSGLIVTGVARFNDILDYVLGTAVDDIIRRTSVPVLVVKQRPHAPYSTLLVAIDLSAASRAALVHAAEMFPAAVLHLVHAAQMPFEGRLYSEDTRAEFEADSRRKLAQFLDHPSVPQAVRDRAQLRMGYGEVNRVLGEALAETGADLLVLGTEGASTVRQATLGSTAASLLSWVPQDTLVVRT